MTGSPYRTRSGRLTVEPDGPNSWFIRHTAWPHANLTVRRADLPVYIHADDNSLTVTRDVPG